MKKPPIRSSNVSRHSASIAATARRGSGDLPRATGGPEPESNQRPGSTQTTKSAGKPTGKPAAELVLTVQHQMAIHDGFQEAATAACMTLSTQLKASRVSVGWINAHLCRTVASSRGAPKLMPEADRDAISEAMQESVNQQRTVCSINPDGVRCIVVASKALAKMQSGGTGLILTVPLATRKQSIGAICIEFDTSRAQAAARQVERLSQLVEAVVPVASRLLELEHERALPISKRLTGRYKKLLADQSDRSARYRRLAAGSAIATLSTILLIPMDMQISSDARIEGAVQRSVAAPTDGYLRSVDVRPGDRVFANQVLATLGERELELQRDRLTGQVNQYQGDASTAIANGDRAAMAVARAKVEQATAELELITRQLQQTRVRAPFSGVVIGGDLTRSVGAPVDRGQNLFTIAPADSWRVIVEIDERDIMQVKEGQTGTLYLSSLPWQDIQVAVDRITPAAEVVDGKNVFEVHASIVEPSDSLRSGLRGTVRLAGERQNLTSRLFRQISEAVGRVIWRWRPW